MKIILNAATSIDGKIATVNGDTKISSTLDLLRVHRMRSKIDAILVGINTVIKDDPLLTSRVTEIKKLVEIQEKTEILKISYGKPDNSKFKLKTPKNPIRVIIDSKATISMNSTIVRTANQIKTIVAVTNQAPKKKLEQLYNIGLKIRVVDEDSKINGRVDLKKLLKGLENEEGISSILVEGGGEINWSFIKQNLFDELIITVSPVIIGGKNATTLVDGTGYKIKK